MIKSASIPLLLPSYVYHSNHFFYMLVVSAIFVSKNEMILGESATLLGEPQSVRTQMKNLSWWHPTLIDPFLHFLTRFSSGRSLHAIFMDATYMCNVSCNFVKSL